MVKKYLDKVIDRLVSETEIDYDTKGMYLPFLPLLPYPFPFSILSLPHLSSPPPSFLSHCKEVYGLNDDEINYVWDEYKNIIINKIEDGQ